ncbi:hypothetical protein B0H11DRAFT_2114555 [Mycena galericulata]|nr:hypothetical protein B0H11DRAFT_2114555 [Mycena galericulata]
MKVRFTGSTKSLDAPPSRHKHVKGARKHPPRKTIDQVHTTGSGSSGALASASKMGFHYNYAPFDPAVGAVRIPLAPMVPSYSTPVARHADGAKTADAFAHINHGSRHSIAGAIPSVLGVGFHPAGLAVAPPRLPNAPMVSSSTLDSGYTAKENATARIGRTNPGLCAPKRAREGSAGDEEPAPKRKCLQRTYAFVFTGPATTPEEPECSVPSGSK